MDGLDDQPRHCGGISVCRWSPPARPIGVVERCPELGQVDRVDRSDPWDEHGIGPGNIPQPAGQPRRVSYQRASDQRVLRKCEPTESVTVKVALAMLPSTFCAITVRMFDPR